MSDARHEARIDRDTLCAFLAAAGDVAPEVRLHITPEAYTVNVVDVANVALANIELPAAAFDWYEAADTTVGIGAERLAERVRALPDGETVVVAVDESIGQIEVGSDTASVSHLLFDPDELRQEPAAPVDHEKAWFTVDGTRFADAIAFLDGGVEKVRIEHEPGSVDLWLSDFDGDDEDAEARIPIRGVTPGASEGVDSAYALDYLTDMVPHVRGHDVELGSGEAEPLRLRIDDADGLTALLMLAPRIMPEQDGPKNESEVDV